MSKIKSTLLYKVERQFVPHEILGTQYSRKYHALERYMQVFPQFDPVDPVVDNIEMTPDGFYISVKVSSDLGEGLPDSKSSIQQTLLKHCLKPKEIAGEPDVRETRANELVRWFARLADGNANSKWLGSHAFELAHYIASKKGM